MASYEMKYLQHVIELIITLCVINTHSNIKVINIYNNNSTEKNENNVIQNHCEFKMNWNKD